MERHIEVIGRPELCRLLRISPTTLDRMRAAGSFPVPPLGWPGHPRWSRASVAKWLGGDPDLDDQDFALLTLTEVAELLGVTRATAYRHLQTGPLSATTVQANRERRYPRVAVSVALRGDVGP